MRFLQEQAEHLYTALPFATISEIISELPLLRDNDQFLLPKRFKTRKVALIFQTMPENTAIFISHVEEKSIKILQEAIATLLPHRYLGFTKKVRQENVIRLISYLSAGVKLVLPDTDFQMECLSSIPPYTYITCWTSINIHHLKNLIKNLPNHCIFEFELHWGLNLIEELIEILPPHTGCYSQNFLILEKIVQKIKPHHLFPIPNISISSYLNNGLDESPVIKTIPKLIERSIQTLLSQLPANCIIFLSNPYDAFYLSRLSRLLQPGNLLLIHHQRLFKQINMLPAHTGIQFCPWLSKQAILMRVGLLKPYQTYAVHPLEKFSFTKKVLHHLPQNTGILFSTKLRAKNYFQCCRLLQAFQWLVTPYHFSQDILLKGLQQLGPYRQVMIHPHLLPNNQVMICQNLPAGIIYTPHPKTNHLQLIQNVQNLNSLSIYMPIFASMFIDDSLKELNANALYMQNNRKTMEETIQALSMLKHNHYFMPHPQTSPAHLLTICQNLPKHLRYMPNPSVRDSINLQTLKHLNPLSTISIHPKTKRSSVKLYLQSPQQFLHHPDSPSHLYRAIYQQSLTRRTIVQPRFYFFQQENSESVIETIKTLPAFCVYTPHPNLPRTLIAECIKNLPPQVIFRPDGGATLSSILEYLELLPQKTIFSPGAHFDDLALQQCLDYFPNNCLLMADILMPQYLVAKMNNPDLLQTLQCPQWHTKA